MNDQKTDASETGRWWERFLFSLTPFYEAHSVCENTRNKGNELFQACIIRKNDYVLYEDTKHVLRECAQRGYRNYLLSNNYPELPFMVKELGLYEYFSDLFVSALIGYEKPRSELFAYAKKKANCSSGLMVGDNPVADILGAKAAGLKAVLVHREEPSQADATCSTLKEILEIL